MQIVQAPNPVLSEKAKTIKSLTKPILDLIEHMKETLLMAKDPEGVGLAAPQVGEGLQIFIIKQSVKAHISVYINPNVTILQDPVIKNPSEKKRKTPVKLEGCLSLKDIWGTVYRSPKIAITYMDDQGKHHEKECSGFLATIMQHEYDHLNGILFPRRVLEQNGQLYKSHRNDKDEDEFDEITI